MRGLIGSASKEKDVGFIFEQKLSKCGKTESRDILVHASAKLKGAFVSIRARAISLQNRLSLITHNR